MLTIEAKLPCYLGGCDSHGSWSGVRIRALGMQPTACENSLLAPGLRQWVTLNIEGQVSSSSQLSGMRL